MGFEMEPALFAKQRPAATDPFEEQFETTPAYGEALESPKCQVSPPRKITPIPDAIETDAQLPEHCCIPGECSQGPASLVPEFVSEPLAATK
jgi:hypothetical protein